MQCVLLGPTECGHLAVEPIGDRSHSDWLFRKKAVSAGHCRIHDFTHLARVLLIFCIRRSTWDIYNCFCYLVRNNKNHLDTYKMSGLFFILCQRYFRQLVFCGREELPTAQTLGFKHPDPILNWRKGNKHESLIGPKELKQSVSDRRRIGCSCVRELM